MSPYGKRNEGPKHRPLHLVVSQRVHSALVRNLFFVTRVWDKDGAPKDSVDVYSKKDRKRVIHKQPCHRLMFPHFFRFPVAPTLAKQKTQQCSTRGMNYVSRLTLGKCVVVNWTAGYLGTVRGNRLERTLPRGTG